MAGAALSAICAPVGPLAAQVAGWDLQVILSPTLPARVDVLAKQPGYLTIVVTYTGSRLALFEVRSRLSASSGLSGSASSVPRSAPGPGTHLFTNATRALVDDVTLRLPPVWKDLAQRGGMLPADRYQFCAAVYVDGRAVTGERCATTTVESPLPPVLLQPAEGVDVPSATPVFSWTPATQVDATRRVRYGLRIAELPAGRLAAEALGALAWHEAEIDGRTQYVYPISALPLKDGVSYAWQVTAYDADGAPYGTGGGRSQMQRFTYRDPAAAVALGAVELVAGLAEISSLRGVTVVGGDANRLIVTGQVPVRLTLPGAAARELSASVRDLVIQRAPGRPRVVGGEIEAPVGLDLAPGARIERMRRAADGSVAFAGVLTVGGVELRATGSTAPGRALLEAPATGGAPLARIGSDTAAVLVRSVRIVRAGTAPQVDAAVELFGRPAPCAPSTLRVTDSVAVADFACSARPDSATLALVDVRGRLRTARSEVVSADLALGLDATIPFVGAKGPQRLNGRFARVAGLSGFSLRLPNAAPTLALGALRLRIRSVAAPAVSWTRAAGWDVRVVTRTDVAVPVMGLAIAAVDSVVLTPDALELPAVERDGGAFEVPSFTGGNVRVRPRAVRWGASRLPWRDGGTGWVADLSGIAGVAHVSACVQGIAVPAAHGRLTVTRLDWPLDTARIGGICTVRKPDGSMVAVEAVTGSLSGTFEGDSLRLQGRAALVERLIAAATVVQADSARPAPLDLPALILVPGGSLRLRDAGGSPRARARRVDARTLELTPVDAAGVPFDLLGGLGGVARFASVRYDTRSERLTAGTVSVAFTAGDARRVALLAAVPAEVDSLVVRGDPVSPEATLYAGVRLFGRRVGSAVALAVNEQGEAAGTVDVRFITPSTFDLVSGGAMQLAVTRISGSVRIPLAGGVVQRDLLINAQYRAPGLARPVTLRVPDGGEGVLAVVAAAAVTAVTGPGAPSNSRVRLDSLEVGRLAWTAAGGFTLRSVAVGRLLLPLRAGGTLEVPLPSVLLTERELSVSAARVVQAGPATSLTPGVVGRITAWNVPSWRVSWRDVERVSPASLSAAATLQYDRVPALRAERFTAQLVWRADSTVCGSSPARPLARPALLTQAGVQFRIGAVTPVLPACAAGRADAFALRAQVSVARPAALQSAADAWPFTSLLALDVATGALSGTDTMAVQATARVGALEVTLGMGAVVVRPDTVTWQGRAGGRLVAPQAAATPSGSGAVVFDLGRVRLVSGRIEVTTPFAWRVPSGAGVLAVQVPRALLDPSGATFTGTGTVTGTNASIRFDSLRLDAAALRIVGGSARVLGTLPLALGADGWRVANSGLVTLPLVDALLDAGGLSAGGALAANLAAPGATANGLDVRLSGDFRFAVNPGAVSTGRADLHEGAGANAARRAWIDSLGLHLEGVAPALPDVVALPSLDIAYARLRVGGQPVAGTVAAAGNAVTFTTAATPLDVVFPALGGAVVPMVGSITIDNAGRVTGGSLTASLGATPLSLPAGELPLQIRSFAFGPVAGVLGMRAAVSLPGLPGLSDLALPSGDLTLASTGLAGSLASGSCSGAGAAVAEQTYAAGALTVRLLGVEANPATRTLCAKLDAVARFGAAGSPTTTIPVSASWNVASGQWQLTASAQQLPEVPIGVAVLAPDAAQGVTVQAQNQSFALVLRGAVRFPQALGDGVSVAIDELRIATNGVFVTASSNAPQTVSIFENLLSLRTSQIAATYTAGVLSLTIDGALSMLGRSNLAMEGLVLRSTGEVLGGRVQFGASIGLLANRLSLTSLAFSSQGGRLGADLGGSLSLPTPFAQNAPFTVRVRADGAGWTSQVDAPSVAFGTGLVIGDNAATEVDFGGVATFDLLNLGFTVDLRSPRNSRITAAAALYLMNDVARAVVFGNPSNAAVEPGLSIDRNGVRWSATLPAGLPTLDLGLFRYALTAFGGTSVGGSFGFEFAGRASLDVPGVTGTLSLDGLRLGLDGATPGSLGAGPHELSLLNGIASFSIGAMARGANTTITLTGAGGGGSANAATTTVQAVEFLRLTRARITLGAGYFEGGVKEVLVYRLANGTRSIGVTDAALSLAGITELHASMRYENGPDGFRLSAGGSATIIGGTGFGAAGFFSNRRGQLGAGLFVAANANIPLLPPLISLAGIGGGLFINPTGEDIQMVLDVVENMGMRLVGAPPTLPGPRSTIGFAAFLYANAGLLGVAGGYAIEGKAFLQVTTVNTRIDVRGVLLGQTDRLTAGVSVEVVYGDGWRVTGAGEADIDFPGVDGHAQLGFMLGNQGGNFTWAIEGQASLDVVAFNASGAFFVSDAGFYAEVGIGSGFSYGPVDVGAEVVVGVFLDASRPKFGAFGIVSAYVDLTVVSASATLKGALVVTRNSVYLGFSGVARVYVEDWGEVSAGVHASFDNGDFSAGLGRDKKLDRIIDDMRSTARQIESSATAAAADMRAAAEANWWRASERTLDGAGYALLNLPAADRERILAPVLAAEALTVLPVVEDRGSGYSLSPSALRQWVLDSIYSDPSRPRADHALASKAAFEGAVAATGTIAAAVLERVRFRIDGIAAGASVGDDAGGSPLSVQATPGQPLRLTLNLSAYDAVTARAQATGNTDGSLDAATAAAAQAEGALDSLDAVLGGTLAGASGATLGNAGEFFALSHNGLQRWQAERVAIGFRAKRWSDVRRAGLGIRYGLSGRRYQFGWLTTLAGGLNRYAQLTDAAVARRRAMLQLAALSPTFEGETALSDAETFRTELLALDRTPGNDGPFMEAVAGTWSELWYLAPNRGLASAAAAAEGDALALIPALAVQRDSLARRHQVLTTAVDELFEGRLAMTAQVAALYDEIRSLDGSPPAWTTRRDALMQDLEPPSLGGIRVQSTTADGIATNAISWTASHPGGIAGIYAAASRDGGAVPQFFGVYNLLTTTTVREALAGDFQRRYLVAVKARSRAGAAVTRAATVDVDVPSSVQDEGGASPPVQNAADPAPAAPVVAFLYPLREPLPLNQATQGVGFEVAAAPNAGRAPPAVADTRVYFWHDPTSLDIDVSGLNLGDLAALEVAIGTTRNGVDVRAFAVAPAMPTASGHRRILLRGLSLTRDVDYWVRVRARDAAGQVSPVATTARPVRIDDRAPAAPTTRGIELRADVSMLVRLVPPDAAPSGFRKYEYVVTRTANGSDAFDASTPVPWGADTVVIASADITPGQSTWLHIRSVSYAGRAGPLRSIEMRPPLSLVEALGLEFVAPAINVLNQQAEFGQVEVPVFVPTPVPPMTPGNARPPGRAGAGRAP